MPPSTQNEPDGVRFLCAASDPRLLRAAPVRASGHLWGTHWDWLWGRVLVLGKGIQKVPPPCKFHKLLVHTLSYFFFCLIRFWFFEEVSRKGSNATQRFPFWDQSAGLCRRQQLPEIKSQQWTATRRSSAPSPFHPAPHSALVQTPAAVASNTGEETDQNPAAWFRHSGLWERVQPCGLFPQLQLVPSASTCCYLPHLPKPQCVIQMQCIM